MSSPVFPIALRAGNRHAIVVGAGSVAARKVRALLGAGIRLVVVAPAVDESLRALASDGVIELRERPYERSDVGGAAMAIAATGNTSVDERVIADARAEGVLACDATEPRRGDFTMMSTLRLGDLTVALDSGGSSPSFSRRMLDEIGAAFGDEYADAARTLARIRREVRVAMPRDERIALLRRLSGLPIRDLAAAAQSRRVVCASRASALAMVQTRTVAAALAQRGIATEILDVTTVGDRDTERPLHQLGETNVFVTELERALRERSAQYAVHSAKDLPSELSGDMCIAAISTREDPRDAFCSERYANFEDLPAGAIVGTSSLRRRVQLERLRPDLSYADLRGNVDTRLRKLRDGRYDAIVLALAGLRRLGTQATYTVPWPVDVLIPAAGQGALAVEVLSDDALLAYELRAAVNDPRSERCVLCERAALRTLRAGCSAPIGVHARVTGEQIRVDLGYATQSGFVRESVERACATVEDAEALGEDVARRVCARMTATAGAGA